MHLRNAFGAHIVEDRRAIQKDRPELSRWRYGGSCHRRKPVRKSFIIAISISIAIAMVVSCKKDEPQAAPQPAPSASTASAPSAVPPPPPAESAAANVPPPDTDKLPTPDEQQGQARKAVSRANYKAQLDAVEKELNGIK
jgi:type IV secretory pathway VirB10-like protein